VDYGAYTTGSYEVINNHNNEVLCWRVFSHMEKGHEQDNDNIIISHSLNTILFNYLNMFMN